jgi:hypothetical protein
MSTGSQGTKETNESNENKIHYKRCNNKETSNNQGHQILCTTASAADQVGQGKVCLTGLLAALQGQAQSKTAGKEFRALYSRWQNLDFGRGNLIPEVHKLRVRSSPLPHGWDGEKASNIAGGDVSPSNGLDVHLNHCAASGWNSVQRQTMLAA